MSSGDRSGAPTVDDLQLLRSGLAGVESAASELAWAEARPWRVTSHVAFHGGYPLVDLHDLDRRGAREAVRIVCGLAPELESGAVRFVTGRGRHSMGAGGVLVHTVKEDLGRECLARGWRMRAIAGGWILVVDPKRAPRAATGELGPWFWVLSALFLVAAAVAVLREAGWL